jgi:hypothetical protein
LETGDILIVKDFGNVRDSDSDSNFIRIGQAVFSHVRGGSAFSEHVLMCRLGGTENTVESVGEGLVKRSYVTARQHAVYRCTIKTSGVARMGAEAVKVGLKLAGMAGIDEALPYGHGKMALSPFRLKYHGRFASRYVNDVYEFVYNKGPKRHSGMICSEFVALCYEVAGQKLLDHGVLDVDPRAMTAKALEAMLNRSADFQLVGRYEGDGPPAPQVTVGTFRPAGQTT